MLASVHLFCIGKLDNYISKYMTVSSERLSAISVNFAKQQPDYTIGCACFTHKSNMDNGKHEEYGTHYASSVSVSDELMNCIHA